MIEPLGQPLEIIAEDKNVVTEKFLKGKKEQLVVGTKSRKKYWRSKRNKLEIKEGIQEAELEGWKTEIGI